MTRNPTFSHLLNPSFDDAADSDARAVAHFVTDYGLTAERRSGGFPWLSELIFADARDRKDFLWIPDANIAIKPEAEPVWEALQRAHSLDYKTQCLLLPAVEAELSEWLNEPFRKKELASSLRASLERGTGFCRRTRQNEFAAPVLRIVDYYVSLLAARRSLAVALENGKTLLSVDASNKSLAMSKVTEHFGPRGKIFAKSGRNDFEKRGEINANDEGIVALAFATSVVSKQHVCILTTDQQVLDSFYKMQWFLDTHYRSYLVGQAIADGIYESSTVATNAAIEHCFEGPCSFYKKRSWCFDEVIRPRSEYVSFEVMHIEQDGKINWLRFKWEPELQGMLDNKLADGRNSSIFDVRNVHIATAPLGKGVGAHIVVGQDRTTKRHDLAIPIGMLDFQHAVHSEERHTTVAKSAIDLRLDE